jgi:hypothetical protein
MNTITINTETNGEVTTITYTEAEVLHFRKRMQDIDVIEQANENQRKQIRDLRHEVRDFFSEGEWQDGETTCNKGDVNALLERIGANKLTSQYTGTFTITGSFTVEAEDEDAAETAFTDYVDISFNEGDYSMDNVEVQDVEEDN